MREWGAREIAPRIKDLDREHRFDRDILPQMAELRPARHLACPASAAARAWTTSASGLASEELEYVDTSLRVIMSVHAGLNSPDACSRGAPRRRSSSTSCRRRRGEKIATFGLTEPAAGSDVRGIQSVAVQAGRPLRADRREDVDLARRRRGPLPGRRLDATWRRRSSATRPACRRSSWSAASRASRAARSRRSGASSPATPATSRWTRWRCPEENVLGRPGEGFKIAMFALDQGRYTVAAGATGLIRACRDASGEVREGAQDVRRRDRPAPAGEGDDRRRWSPTTRRRGCSGCGRAG
ncbi:MAG: acyl-CoA dehydrogenase family protein [Ignavibacteriales bacterium]|nr:acyl-CoA dehydrogenase family protein [Ignavibacteriales bacterium]